MRQSASRGAILDLAGEDGGTIAELLGHLPASGRRRSIDVARIDGKDGVAARDPRTGARALRLKDVLRGELDVFLEAWRQGAAR